MEVRMKIQLAVVCLAFGVSLFASESALGQAPNTGSGAKDGDSCKVTAGANKGKTGTYTEGGTWCEGDWGGTECTDQQGNSKCSSALTVHHFPKNDVAILNGYFEATQPSAGPDKLKQWEEKYNAKVVKKSENVIVISHDNKTLIFDGSREKLAKQFSRSKKD
jgi:hypothetical protein